MLLLVQICVIKSCDRWCQSASTVLYSRTGESCELICNVGFLFGNGHAGSSEEHRPDDKWWHSVAMTYHKHLKPFEQTTNPVMFLMRNPRQRPWARHSSPTCSFITSLSGWRHHQLNTEVIILQGHIEGSIGWCPFISFEFICTDCASEQILIY